MTQEIQTLVDQAKKGSEKAFTTLFNKYYRLIRYVVYDVVKNIEVANDLASIVFTKAHKKFETYVEHISFEMWLKTIALHTAIDFLRRTKKERLNYYMDDDEAVPIQIASESLNPEDDMAIKEKLKNTLNAIETLKPKYKNLIKARIDGLSYKEMAEKFESTELQVKSDLNKARQILRKKTQTFSNTYI